MIHMPDKANLFKKKLNIHLINNSVFVGRHNRNRKLIMAVVVHSFALIATTILLMI